MTDLPRRKLLHLAPLGLAQLVVNPKDLLAQYICPSNLSQIKDHKELHEDYLIRAVRCLPEFTAAKDSGMLKGFLYDPSDKKLEISLEELFSQIARDGGELKVLVQRGIANYKGRHPDTAAMLSAGIVSLFGHNVASYIIFTQRLFSHSSVKNDADVISLFKHDLKHVEDYYKGITLGNMHLSSNQILADELRVDFYKNLMELRAEYTELRNAFKERVDFGRTSISPKWFGFKMGNYYCN